MDPLSVLLAAADNDGFVVLTSPCGSIDGLLLQGLVRSVPDQEAGADCAFELTPIGWREVGKLLGRPGPGLPAQPSHGI